MPDVHGRPTDRDIKASSNCDQVHVRVVTASDVHFSRTQMTDVLEQVLLGVCQDEVRTTIHSPLGALPNPPSTSPSGTRRTHSPPRSS
jgi:hypothetical protein